MKSALCIPFIVLCVCLVFCAPCLRAAVPPRTTRPAPRLPLIAASGLMEDVKMPGTEGAVTLLRKPIESQTLLSVVRDRLDMAAAEAVALR